MDPYFHFLEYLRKKIPNFEKIDRDPAFLKWVDSLGISLKKIGQDMDFDRAEYLYRTWIQKQKKEQRTKKKHPPAWTRKGIEQAYKDIQQGKYSPEQATRIKESIFQANRQGAVSG